MNYWILQHNPAILRPNPNPCRGVPPNRDYWRIGWYKDSVSIGDQAFIWYSGHDRGIYNVAKVVSVPNHNPQHCNQLDLLWNNDRPYYNPEALQRLEQYPAILIDYEYPGDLDLPLLVGELRREHFGNLPIIHMWRHGIYRLDLNVGKRLLEYIRRSR